MRTNSSPTDDAYSIPHHGTGDRLASMSKTSKYTRPQKEKQRKSASLKNFFTKKFRKVLARKNLKSLGLKGLEVVSGILQWRLTGDLQINLIQLNYYNSKEKPDESEKESNENDTHWD